MPVLAVGAAFDYHAGRLSPPPEALQRLGLEWAFRLSREPRRLWRRYVLLNPYFVVMVCFQLTRVTLPSFRSNQDFIAIDQLNYG
jgi:UDP-N-acetyl-D-mannosaminuronic acid transferase (WecB/TagA/CpsF family)